MSDVISALDDDPKFFRADIHITPPENGMASDEDSATEDDTADASLDNLCGNQLRAQQRLQCYVTLVRRSV